MALDIRLVTGPDAAGIAEIYAPIVASTAISFEIEPPDERETRRRIEETLPRYPWLVCEQDGRVVGYAYATRHRTRAAYQWSVDMSVYVHPDLQRRGIGRGLYLSLIEILKAQGYFRAYAGIALPNPGSVGLHESVGFQSIGVYRNVGFKLGAWHDVGWWELVLQLCGPEPRAPLSVVEVQKDPSWPRMLAGGLEHLRESH
jgi:L-amino acid N-acyltransferase YncA